MILLTVVLPNSLLAYFPPLKFKPRIRVDGCNERVGPSTVTSPRIFTLYSSLTDQQPILALQWGITPGC
jgi:hypothetical protein